MSTLQQFLSKNSKGMWYYTKIFWKEFLNNFKFNKMSNKMDNSWKGIKLSHTITPEGWSKENAFSYLNNEYKGMILKRFKD